jgi:MFS family permease
MIERFRSARKEYPSQFWLLFWGMLISTLGASMLWPFLMIYVSERLSLPMTTVASLMTLYAIVGLFASFIAGPFTDRIGRKWAMVISLGANGLAYFLMSRADTLLAFAWIMGMRGVFVPLYRVGADAMLADLIDPDERVEAYSLLRMINNVAIALGPTIGGFVATSSYTIAFYLAASGLAIYSLLLFFFAVETLPEGKSSKENVRELLAGYQQVAKDKSFMALTTTFTFTQVCATLIWVLLAVYAKQNYQVPERQYGLIPTTNALMVVLLQINVTKVTKRYKPLRVLALGSFFYTLGVGSVALGEGFWGFWTSMVILTTGELMLVPTASAYAANMAPPDKRGRYMSIYALTWGLAAGIGPILGGLLNDNLGPKTIWYGGAVVGLMSTLSFVWLAYRSRGKEDVLPPPVEV